MDYTIVLSITLFTSNNSTVFSPHSRNHIQDSQAISNYFLASQIVGNYGLAEKRRRNDDLFNRKLYHLSFLAFSVFLNKSVNPSIDRSTLLNVLSFQQ